MKTILLTLLLTYHISAQAQGFMQVFPSERVHDMIEHPEGGFLLVGTTTLTGFPQILIRQTDENGLLLWEKEIPAPSTETAYDITLATDGSGYVLVGNTSEGSDLSNILILKIDWEGELIWRTTYGGADPDYGSSIVAHEDSTYTILGTKMVYEPTDTTELVQVMKINEAGEELWNNIYIFGARHTQLDINLREQTLEAAADGGAYFLGQVGDSTHIVHINDTGNTLQNIPLPLPYDRTYFSDFEVLESGGFVIAGNYFFADQTLLFGFGTYLLRLDETGQVLWEKEYNIVPPTSTFDLIAYSKTAEPTEVEVAENGDFILSSNLIYRPIIDGVTAIRIMRGSLIRTNAAGEQIWKKEYLQNHTSPNYQIRKLIKANNSTDIVLTGNITADASTYNPFEIFLIKVNENGHFFDNFIQGKVVFDENTNCELESEEIGLGNWQVELVGTDTTRTMTDETGNYIFNVNIGDYDLRLIPPNPLWTVCDDLIPVQVQLLDTIAIDFLAQATTDCPQLEVDIATPFLRRCFDNEYIISYQNRGTMTAENAYVEIDLDAALIYQEATLPFSQAQDNVYTFELGDIGVGESGYFRLTATVDCESILGQTHCTEAHIFPDTICPPFEMEWDRASLQAAGICEGDSIVFTIRNVGEGDMEETLQYFVVEDELILMQAPFMLNAGADTSFVIYPEGATYRLEVEQSSDHPGFSSPSVTIEACGTDENGQISTGFVNLFSQDDHDHFIDIDCQENIGAFDPNDKQGFPKGYGNEHFITAITDLEYLIRFQNTGTDTAFTVVIRDELSPFLDIHSIRPGASSHLYDFKITEERTLEFSFEDIMLPDSNVNEAASHGFISFNIRQMPNNPDGTCIENTAGIYFDFNPPVITNTTKHTIGENFVAVATPVIHSTTAPVSILAYPNPFSERVTFDIKNSTANTFRFSLYDMAGQLLRRAHFADLSYEFWRGDLSGGLYFFRIEADGKLLGYGKLVLSY